MIDLEKLTIKKAQGLIKSKQISCKDLTLAYLENIKAKNEEINAYLEVFGDALKQAEELDEKIKNGEDVGELAGIPLAIKDNILIKGKIASSASKILENYHATYDATVIKKLKNAGAIFLGRTNMDEFAMGSSTENSAYGATKNPRDLERVPGGSSGGSAAAVAADMCLAALGSDTGGSIRQPASLCGVVGLKTTYGSVSRYGLMAMASSLDQVGPLTKNVEDAEVLFNAIKGQDKYDATSVDLNKYEITGAPSKLKIGVLKYDKNGVAKEVNEAMEKSIEEIKKLGHEVVEVDLQNLKYSLPCYYIIQPAETSANLARFDGVRYGLSKAGKNIIDDYIQTRGEGFGKEVRRRIMLGTYVLSAGYYDAFYNKAQKVRHLVRKDFENNFNNGIDAIIMPTSPTTAFKIGEKTDDPLQMYLSDIFTVSINLAGVPALSLPVGKDTSGLPIGLQIVAPWFKESTLFLLGKQLENATNTLA
jgi:aspartyl-tRNA(Asn)/glutamyl-tRNA(Gln) amidotransferase subunit A